MNFANPLLTLDEQYISEPWNMIHLQSSFSQYKLYYLCGKWQRAPGNIILH
jgi:hypothetical protein